MEKIVPDGEYDVDFSGLFSKDSNIFGIKFGFKPDTIDESYPSYLYNDLQIENDQNRDISKSNDLEVPCYLVSESKENSKAITTNHNKDDHLYFEGRSKFNSSKLLNSSTILSPTIDSSNNDQSMNSLSEFLLSFDDVSKTFKIDYFNGFIKMNKSRDPDLVSSKIEKCKKYSTKSSSENSQSYIDSIISLYSNSDSSSSSNINQLKKSLNTNLSSSVISNDKTKSYGKSISGISPVKKSSVNSPLQSPIRKAGSLSPSLSSSSTPSSSSSTSSATVSKATSTMVGSLSASTTETTKLSPPLSTSQPIQLAHKTHVPIVKPSSPLKNSSTNNQLKPVNGGTGLKKTHKSLLLRKAERSIGINSNSSYRISKPKLKDNINSLNNSNVKSNRGADIINSNLAKKKESVGLRIRQREIKEARPEQAEFELVLTPPPLNTSQITNDKLLNKTNKVIKPIKKEDTQISKVRSQKIIDDKKKNKSIKPNPKGNTIDTKIDEVEKDNDKVKENNEENYKEEDEDYEEDKTIKIKPLKLSNQNDDKTETLELNKNTEDNKIGNISNDDFNLEFSDWEDVDAIDGPVLSDETELTAGPNDFQVIIEDDPFKNKRENEKKIKEEEKKEKLKLLNTAKITNSNDIKDNIELNKKSKSIDEKPIEKFTSKPKKINETTKPIKNTKPKSTKTTKTTKTSNKATKNPKTTKNSKDEKNAIHEDDETDRELDAELNKAFDDMLDEEDMSEEE